MRNIKQWINKNHLFFRIVLIMTTGIVIIALFIVFFIIKITEDSYINTYSNATNILLKQINSDYYSLHEDVIETLDTCDNSSICKSYLSREDLSSQEESAITYAMQNLFDDTGLLSNNTSSNLLLVGFNGKTYLNNASTKIMNVTQILNSKIVKNALKTPNQIYYQFSQDAFTTSITNGKAIVAIKVLKNTSDHEPYGIAMVMLNRQDFQSFYDTMLDSDVNSVYIIHKDGQILSSNVSSKLGEYDQALLEKAKQQASENSNVKRYDDQNETIIVKEMPFYDSYLVSVVDNAVFVRSVSRLPVILAVCFMLTAIVVMIIFFMIKHTMHPIRLLSNKMPEIIHGNFNNHIEVQGSGEVKELSEAFNFMLDGLNDYVSKMIKLQEEKRLSELHALQMQINPHFIYNTLTSIKFMIWQGNKDQSIQTIDAFIQLLRNTISNSDELIPVQQELENVKHYVLIQESRYGDNVKVHYFIQDACYQYQVLKMILQPFLENAFFHAFNDSTQGVIDVFGSVKKDKLVFEIIDNGSGIEQQQVQEMKERPNEKGRRFSGIGYHNVNERIHLLYGEAYGVNITSSIGQGTIITITLPLLSSSQLSLPK